MGKQQSRGKLSLSTIQFSKLKCFILHDQLFQLHFFEKVCTSIDNLKQIVKSSIFRPVIRKVLQIKN